MRRGGGHPSSGSSSSLGGSSHGSSSSTAPSESQGLAKALAGTGAGVAATALCSPLDVAKTRIQVQSSVEAQAKYSGILQALMTIYREEGVAGWYHGFTPAVCSVGVFWTVYFPCYEYAKESISRSTGLPPSSPTLHITAAGCAGLVSAAAVANPTWLAHHPLPRSRAHVLTHVLHSPSPGDRRHHQPALGSAHAPRHAGAAPLTPRRRRRWQQPTERANVHFNVPCVPADCG